MITVNGTGGAEKVTIDGEKVKEKMELYNYESDVYRDFNNTIEMDIYTEHFWRNSKHILNNNNMIKIHYIQSTKYVRTYTISYIDHKTNEVISSGTFEFKNEYYSCSVQIYQGNDDSVWLIFQGAPSNKRYTYFSVYKLEFNNETIDIIEKCSHKQTLYDQYDFQSGYEYSGNSILGFVVDHSGLYVAERQVVTIDKETHYYCVITTFRFDNYSSNNILQAISTPQKYEITKGTKGVMIVVNNIYYLFLSAERCLKFFYDVNNKLNEEEKIYNTSNLTLPISNLFTYNNYIYTWNLDNKFNFTLQKLVNEMYWEQMYTISNPYENFMIYYPSTSSYTTVSNRPLFAYCIIKKDKYGAKEFAIVLYDFFKSLENYIVISTPWIKSYYASTALGGWKCDNNYNYILCENTFIYANANDGTGYTHTNENEIIILSKNNKPILFSQFSSEISE